LARFQDAPLMATNEDGDKPKREHNVKAGTAVFFDFITQINDADWAKGVMHFCHAWGVASYDKATHPNRKRIYFEGRMVRFPTDEIKKVDCNVTLAAAAKNVPAKYQDFQISIHDGDIHVAMIGPSRQFPFPAKPTKPTKPVTTELISIAETQLPQMIRDARSDATDRGGLIGAKALIQEAIESIPTNPGSISRAWPGWIMQIDALLTGLVKPHLRDECMQFLRRIDLSWFDLIFAGPRSVARPYLQAVLNNLTEEDLRKSTSRPDRDATTAVPPPVQARDPKSVPRPHVAS